MIYFVKLEEEEESASNGEARETSQTRYDEFGFRVDTNGFHQFFFSRGILSQLTFYVSKGENSSEDERIDAGQLDARAAAEERRRLTWVAHIEFECSRVDSELENESDPSLFAHIDLIADSSAWEKVSRASCSPFSLSTWPH